MLLAGNVVQSIADPGVFFRGLRSQGVLHRNGGKPDVLFRMLVRKAVSEMTLPFLLTVILGYK
jgi:hypothetical protein